MLQPLRDFAHGGCMCVCVCACARVGRARAEEEEGRETQARKGVVIILYHHPVSSVDHPFIISSEHLLRASPPSIVFSSLSDGCNRGTHASRRIPWCPAGPCPSCRWSAPRRGRRGPARRSCYCVDNNEEHTNCTPQHTRTKTVR